MVDEIMDLIKDPNKVVFWTGAGIDHDAPTALPLGEELTKFMLAEACGTKISEKILNAWQQNCKIINQMVQNGINENIPRLETVLEGIRMFEKNLIGDNSVLNGLKSFAEAFPNENHYILAECLKNGANIVTVNYDSCIPKAYQDLYHQELKLVNNGNVWIYRCDDDPTSGAIYHLHGVAQSISNIGATLSVVKNPIAELFDEKMSKWLKNKCSFIFLGYGGEDYLDVIPYLRNKVKGNDVTGIYIRHNGGNKGIGFPVTEKSQKEQRLLEGFENNYVIECDTKVFLKRFFNTNHNNVMIKHSCRTWEERFWEISLKFDSNHMIACTLSILHYLNLDPRKILGNDWVNIYRKATARCNIENWYIGNYGFRNAVRSGMKVEALRFAFSLKMEALLGSDIRAGLFSGLVYCFDWLQSRKILKSEKTILEQEEIINWRISTFINRTVYFFFEISTLVPFKDTFFNNRIQRYCERLIKFLELCVQKGMAYFLEVHQLYVAYLDLALLHMLVKKKQWGRIKDYIDKAQEGYGEISSISGIINSKLAEVIFYEMKYLCMGKRQYKNDAKRIYKDVKHFIKLEDYNIQYRKKLRVIERLMPCLSAMCC